ncbi:MAG: hypothetical protein PWQ37_3144 [Candidatus Petromonas sp.]|jgi:hypothetical protein|nr:hypothetical protein [Thermosediminibacterales bacterium]MDK2920411.1 hypothetical protein [Candidatus Petromonas sp.]MDN5302984.1 hypothetical protein [Thermoanaerobacteraceae bacterium]
MAKLRNQTFFCLYDLNKAIRKELEVINNKPFEKMEGSRRSLYETLEKPALKPLPLQPYEYAVWKYVRVNIDYHIEADGNYYSVPYQLVRQQVDVRITAKTVEIFYKNKRVATHIRQFGKKHAYTTLQEHMPPSHQKVWEWTPARIINWSKAVGKNTALLVEALMERKEHPEQAYRACMGIIRLSEKYTKESGESRFPCSILWSHLLQEHTVHPGKKALINCPWKQNPHLPLWSMTISVE